MTDIYTIIFTLLASGFSYPSKEEFNDKFFDAIKVLAKDLGINSFNTNPSLNELQESYTSLFINRAKGKAAFPYASCYISTDNLLMQDSRDKALSFYEKIGLKPKLSNEPEDFLATELYFIAELTQRNEYELLASFLNHILKWYPLFRKRLLSLDPHPFYATLANMTQVLLDNLYQEVIDEKT